MCITNLNRLQFTKIKKNLNLWKYKPKQSNTKPVQKVGLRSIINMNVEPSQCLVFFLHELKTNINYTFETLHTVAKTVCGMIIIKYISRLVSSHFLSHDRGWEEGRWKRSEKIASWTWYCLRSTCKYNKEEKERIYFYNFGLVAWTNLIFVN